MLRILLAIFSLTTSPTLLQAAPAKRISAEQQLHELLNADWERNLKVDPIMASFNGDSRYNDIWPDLSMDAIHKQQAAEQQSYQTLLKIPRQSLDEDNRLNYDLYKGTLEDRLESLKYREIFMPVSQRFGPHTVAVFLNQTLDFATAKDYQDWLARLGSYDRYLEQNIELMREGMKSGWMPARVLMDRVAGQIENQMPRTPEESSFYEPFLEMPVTLPSAEQEKLRRQARTLIQNKVMPALLRFQKFFVTEYHPASRQSTAAGDLPSGKDYYNHLIRFHTSTRLTADQIHALGLSEVERLLKAIDRVKDELKFQGTRQELFQDLRSNPKFSYKNAADLLTAYRALAKQVDPELSRIFRKLPRTPYGVVPIPDATAPDTTTAYYMPATENGDRPGQYYVNLYKPETRLTWEMLPLTLHEAVPGHHLQFALKNELGDLPKFRKYAEYTAYTEGWALYAETLGYDMGLYKNPYDRLGQLSFEIWRAVRLVVDTGLHVKGWTRQQAIDYFIQNAPRPENDIVNEIDRYISTPGQALAYKIGEIRMRQLREFAQAQFKGKFDLRDFHEKVLEAGPLPLEVLERRVNAWVRSRTK